jgi:DNA-directed RNA polymerase subunit beta'
MPYVAIPSNLKNVDSISLGMMSPEEMTKMSFGEVLTAETINYRTGKPQMNGLFCEAIFGPTKDWECHCGKYKRYRYAGVICDKCGVTVTHSSVRRERMGHISLAAPCIHPWYLRVIPARCSLILDMKVSEVSRVTYFSAYVITHINEVIREEYISKIDQEAAARVKQTESDFDKRFEELSRQYQIDKSSGSAKPDALKVKYEADKEILKTQQQEIITRIETISQVAKKDLAALKYKDVITEVTYQELASKFGPVFRAGIGAEAIETLLKDVHLETEYAQLREDIQTAKGQTKKKLSKRIKLIKYFINNETRPEWMILKRIMVLPPNLRPMLQLDGGRFAASDLNELYRRLINRNNRLRKLIQIGAPEVILRNEKRMLQESVEALIDNSARSGRQVLASSGNRRALKSLTDYLKGKQGRFRQNLLGKRVDYSGRSVIIVGPQLKLDQCGLPKEMALELFKPFLIGRIISKSEAGILPEMQQSFNVHSARRLIDSKIPLVYDILDEIINDKYVLLNRAPTLHRLSFLAFKPVLTEGKAIQLHPMVCQAFNADFDGDQMAVHLPITVNGQDEARRLMASTKNLLKPASGELIMAGHQDFILGAYYLTNIPEETTKPRIFANADQAEMAYNHGSIKINELIKVRLETTKGTFEIIDTSIGRIIFNKPFPIEMPFVNEPVVKKLYGQLMDDAFFFMGQDEMAKVLDLIKDMTYKFANQSGLTMSAMDLSVPAEKAQLMEETRNKVTQIKDFFNIGMMTEEERYKQTVSTWRDTSDLIFKMSEKTVKADGNIGMMVLSGARGNMRQIDQMVGMKGLIQTAAGRTLELPSQHSIIEGQTGLEYFMAMRGARKGQADISLKTADSGYLTRRLVDVAQNLIIMNDDCDTHQGLHLTDANKIGSKTLFERAYGRYALRDVVDPKGKVIAEKGTFLERLVIEKMRKAGVEELFVRSATKCLLPRGICKMCYGADFSTHKPVVLGAAVGIIGAQSLGENSTQLTMNQGKHGVGASNKAADITVGLSRVEEVFEARTPKFKAIISPINGVVAKVEGDIVNGFVVTLKSQDQVLSLPYDKDHDTLLVGEGDVVSTKDALIVHSTGEIVSAVADGEIVTQDDKILINSSSLAAAQFDTLPGQTVLVKEGETVTRGQAISEGSMDLQELLDLAGINAVQDYIVREITEIYMSNGLNVNEKHMEVIIKQMSARVNIVTVGDSDLVTGDIAGLPVILNMNAKLAEAGKETVTFKRTITGISRASLTTESFLSAASFQETSRVLVEAVVSGRTDNLLGLKENVILGQLIPAGTGFNSTKAITTEVEEEFDEMEMEVAISD